MSPLLAIHVTGFDVLLGASSQGAGGIVITLIPLIVLAMVLSLLGRFLRSPKMKGRFGEAVVSVGALKRLDHRVYRVFNDLFFPRPDGKGTTQIDHIVVSPFGIFVIETKNMTGWIFGDVASRQWTQCIYGKKQRFQNPLHQNALHVNALARLLGLAPHCFHNLVFFAGDATLKTDLPSNVMTRGLRTFIEARREEIIEPGELERIISRLDAVQAGTDKKKAHREHVLQMKGR